MRKILYFTLFVALSITAGCVFMNWHYIHKRQLEIQGEPFAPGEVALTSADLTGTWHGRDNWPNTRYVIIRRSDGTFSEVTDVRHNFNGHDENKPFVRKRGRWWLHGATYFFRYTRTDDLRHTDTGDAIATIHPPSKKEFSFSYGRGEPDIVTEVKQ